MSKPGELPLSDDDPAHLFGSAAPVIEDVNKDKYPGVTMESSASVRYTTNQLQCWPMPTYRSLSTI